MLQGTAPGWPAEAEAALRATATEFLLIIPQQGRGQNGTFPELNYGNIIEDTAGKSPINGGFNDRLGQSTVNKGFSSKLWLITRGHPMCF